VQKGIGKWLSGGNLGKKVPPPCPWMALFSAKKMRWSRAPPHPEVANVLNYIELVSIPRMPGGAPIFCFPVSAYSSLDGPFPLFPCDFPPGNLPGTGNPLEIIRGIERFARTRIRDMRYIVE